MTDQGSQSRITLIDIAKLNDVIIQHTGIESHHSLGIEEQYHVPLCNTFLKLKRDQSKKNKNVLLHMAT